MTKPALLTILLAFANTASFAQDYQTQMTVAQDGTGDFNSVQAAIDASKAFPYERITIHLKNGTYRE